MGDVIFFLHRVYPRSNIKGRDDITLKGFERTLKLLRQRFKFVPLEALLAEKSKEARAAITFDDGYADNYVYAYPVLKKMGIPAHIFISSGRINSGGVRKNLIDYWEGRVSYKELFVPKSMHQSHVEYIKFGYSAEFLSWEELDRIRDVFSFGSHGKNHLAIPISEEIKDFFDGTNFHWTMLLYSRDQFIGLPLFKTGSELCHKRFYPSKDLLEFCRSFEKKGNWKEKLRKLLIDEKIDAGNYESEEKAALRIRKDLIDSKREIEEKLGVRVTTFAWPFGHYNDFGKKIAGSVYDYLFTIKKGFISCSSDKKELPRVSLGKDIFTVIGRILTFSTGIGFTIYKCFKRRKVL